MKILMTGSNASQCGSDKVLKGFFGIQNALRVALEAMGHEVEQRVPNPEADIQMQNHDLIVCGVACLATLGGRYSQDVYWMVSQWQKHQFPMVMYASDWHMKQLHSTVEGLLKTPDRIREKSQALGRPHHDWAMDHVDEILEGAQAINRGDWPPFILHRFPWGSEAGMAEDVRTRNPWSLDPSGYMPQWPFDTPDFRMEEWTCPRLQTLYDRWLDEISARCEWPITRFGNQRLQEPQVTEDRIPQILAEAAGTLVPPGYHSGWGLWRSRYLMAAWTRTPLYAATEEGMIEVDESFGVTPIAIEAMLPEERNALAGRQARAILDRVWNRQQFVDKLHDLLAHAMGRDLGVAPEVPAEDAEPPKPIARTYHPLLQRGETNGKLASNPRSRMNLKICCAAMDLMPDQKRIRGHHPACDILPQHGPARQPRVCACLGWERLPEQGPDIRGHHPLCRKVSDRSSAPATAVKQDRPKPWEDGYLTFDEGSKMHHRPGTLDYYVIREVGAYSRMGITSSDVVVDVGGHIGGFTIQAANRGAQVYTFEPDPENHDILLKNVERFGDKVVVSNRAVISGKQSEVTLYLNVGSNTGTHSLLPSRGRDTVQVPTEDFQSMLHRLQPTVLKVDIEGGEYALDWSSLPPSIRVLCVELHRTKTGLHEKSIELAEQITNLGFEYIKQPKIHGGAWAVLAIWSRAAVPAKKQEEVTLGV